MANEYLDNLKTIVGRWKKAVNDPDYQPTQDENNADNDYYKNLSAAVAGSVVPVEGGILGKEASAVNQMNKTADSALLNQAPQVSEDLIQNQQALLGQAAPEMTQVAQTQNQASRAIDMADRYKSQLAAAKKAALDRLRR